MDYQSPQSGHAQLLIDKIKRLKIKDLARILRGESLAVSGVKAIQQDRLITRVHQYSRNGDTEALARLQRNIDPGSSVVKSHPASPNPAQYPTQTHAQQHSMPPVRPAPMPAHRSASMQFKRSPFYTILESACPPLDCPVMTQNRNTVTTILHLKRAQLDLLSQNNSPIRVMVFGAVENTHTLLHDIAFPNSVELRVNGSEVRANLRGLKNKAGSTRPADITSYIKMRTDEPTHIKVIYALTQKPYRIMVNFVRTHSVDELVTKLKSSNSKISKAKVIVEMKAQSDDADIVATSTVMSLKCPLSTVRIVDPCRSTVCKHNQCFDTGTFLQLQEQAPTWLCPICYKVVSYESLLIDEYVKEILRETPSNTEQVVVQPDGTWALADNSQRNGSRQSFKGTTTSLELESDDGDHNGDANEHPIEISHIQTNVSQTSFTPNGLGINGHSPVYNSGVSTPSGAISKKRPKPEVIDLTLSSDEEPDEPLAKRAKPNFSHSASPYELHRPIASRPGPPERADSHTYHNPGLFQYSTYPN